MTKYKLDIKDGDVKADVIEADGNDQEGMTFNLPDGNDIFLSKAFLLEMGERLGRFYDENYEGQTVEEAYPNTDNNS